MRLLGRYVRRELRGRFDGLVGVKAKSMISPGLNSGFDL